MAIEEEMAPNSLTFATSCNAVGGVSQDHGGLEDALEQRSRALAIQEEKAPNSLAIATSHSNVGLVLKQKEGKKLEDALGQRRRAFEIREEKAPSSLAVATSHASTLRQFVGKRDKRQSL
jgi:hypothetical protein